MGNKKQKLTGVTFILVRPNGEMLLQLRDDKSRYYPNKWCFPGESREGEEDPLETTMRGAEEEYGIRLSKNACQFITINHLPQISQEISVVVCKVGDQIPELHEGKEMRWISMNDIEKLELGFEQNKFLPLVRKKIEESVRGSQ